MIAQNQLPATRIPTTNLPVDKLDLVGQKILYWMGCSLVHRYSGRRLRMDVKWHVPLPAGPKILAANHPTTLDPFLLLTLAPEQISVLVNGDLFKIPLFGRYLRAAGHIPVRRENGRVTMDEAVAELRAGRTIGIFPEGCLSPLDGGINFARPRTGTVRLALIAKVPIIPIGIHLPHEDIRFVDIKVKGKTTQARHYPRGAYGVTVGEPLYLAGDVEDRERVRAGSELIMARIAGLSQESKQRLPAPAPEKMERYATFTRLFASN